MKQTLLTAAKYLVPALLGMAVAAVAIAPRVETVEVERVVPRQVAADAQEPYAQTFGWVKDADEIAANLDPQRTLQFATTPAGRASLGDEDVYLWRAVRNVANKVPPWFCNVNQQSVGCCVGCGWKHGCDVLLATQITAGRPGEWKPVSVEVIYGLSRVEVGGGRISGDGSVGAWAARAVKEYGVVPMERHGNVDLTTFSPARARQFGRDGVSAPLKTVAKEHPVKTTALVTSWLDVKRAIQQGYPVAVCSDQGFRMERDRDGFARTQGSWAHCMCVIGVRGGDRPGGFILNSWGDSAHTGPVFPEDAPIAGFWADSNVIDRMVRQGDSFALSDAVGFPARPLNLFIMDAPRRKFAPFKLAPLEVALAW